MKLGVLKAASARIDVGIVRWGETKKAATWVTNLGKNPVTVVRFEASCPCVEFYLQDPTIQPGARVPLRMVLNLLDEKEFVGNLEIEVRMLDGEKRLLGETRVDVCVQSVN